jgi:hypothetical protein
MLLLSYQHQRYAASWDEAPDEEGEVRGLRVVLEETVWQWVSSWFVGAFAGRPSNKNKAWMYKSEDDDEEEEESIKHKPRWHLRGDPNGKAGMARQPRKLQLLEGAAIRPLDKTNFTTAGLRIAPPYLGLTNCVFFQQCANITTNYGIVSRCKNQRACEVCTGEGTRRKCQFFRITGNPGSLGAQTPFTTNPLVE